MKKIFPFFLLFTVLWLPLANATDRLFVVDDDGVLHELKEKKSILGKQSLEWEKVDESELQKTNFQKLPSAQVVQNGTKVEVNINGQFIDSGFNPPPGRLIYESAVQDEYGNLIIGLGGSGKGFNYKINNGPVLIWNRMEWNPTTPSFNFKQFLPLPLSNQILVVSENGQCYKITPPDRNIRQFRLEEIPQLKGITHLYKANDKIYALEKKGLLLELQNLESSVDAIKTKTIKLPDKASTSQGHFAEIVTNSESPKKIKAFIDQRIQQKQKLNIKTKTVEEIKKHSNSKPAEPIELRNGQVIEPPKSTLAAVENEKGAQAFLSVLDRNMTDEIAMDDYLGKRTAYFGREQETERTQEMLIRLKGSNPVLTGEPGVGKTAIAEYLAQKSFYNEIPEALRFQNNLKDAIWVETNSSLISMLQKSNDKNSQALAIQDFIKSMEFVQKKIGKPIVVFIDEAHTLSEAQLNALKPVLERKNSPLRFVFSTTNREYGLMVQRDGAIERRMPRISVDEFSKEKTRKLLKETVVPYYEAEYKGYNGNAKITDDAIEQTLLRAREYAPNSAFPEGPIKLLMDVITREHRLAKQQSPHVDRMEVGKFLKDELKLPFDPTDQHFDEHLEKAKLELHDQVVEQNKFTDGLVNGFRNIIDSEDEKTHRIYLVAGPTGAGKTYGAEETIKKLVGEERLLVIDGTKYANANGNINIIMNDLLGAPPGIISSDQTRGILPEFLSGRGRGINGIVINEADKMDPEALKRLMEMFDKGVLQANDGKSYRLGRSMTVLTTNKGSEVIYPRGAAGKALSRKELEDRVNGFSSDEIKDFFRKPSPNNLYDNSKTVPPEVLQRINDAFAVLPPTDEGALKILRNEAEKKVKNIQLSKGYRINVSDDVLKTIVKTKYDPQNGMREPNRILLAAIEEAKVFARKNKIAPGDTITFGAQQGERKGEVQFVVKHGEQLIGSVPMPNLRNIKDPLADPEMREKLQNLERYLGKHVFGQDEMIAGVSELVRNQFANPMLESPVSALLMGPTGIGKTELGKTLAKELFKSEDRAEIIPLGDVSSEYHFNNIFNPPKGVNGSQTQSKFEQFLEANEHAGGVIILDEIGNMGGGKPEVKQELLKKFYSILQEGTWTNPVTGKTYDLRKFLFIMTTNEGQEFFNNLPTDDLRLAMFHDSKNSANLEKTLKEKHGWPEALIGRIGRVILGKPLVANERTFVAKKFIDQLSHNLKILNGIAGIEPDQNLLEKFSDSFFSHEKGARLMETEVKKGAVSSLITKARLELDPSELENATLKFSLDDNYAGKHYYKGATPPERKVVITLHIMKGGKETHTYESLNLANTAAPKRLESLRESVRTAYHEAGHVVANDTKLTGSETDFVTVRGAGEFGGYARYKDILKRGTQNRNQVVGIIASMLGGNEALELNMMPKDSGWTNDLAEARKIAVKAVTEWGLAKNPYKLPLDSKGKVEINNSKTQEEIQELLEDGANYARKRLIENWSYLRLIEKNLLQKGMLSREDLAALKIAANSKTNLKPRNAEMIENYSKLCQDKFAKIYKK